MIWLQGLFKNRPRGDLRWTSNADESEIVISATEPTAQDTMNKRPFIVVGRGPAVLAPLGKDGTLSRSVAADTAQYVSFLNTTIVFSCVAREGIEAQKIGYTIMRMIPVFRASIARLGRMHAILQNISIGPETRHEQIVPGSSFPEWRMVQVSVPIQIQDVISSDKDFYNILREVNIHMKQVG